MKHIFASSLLLPLLFVSSIASAEEDLAGNRYVKARLVADVDALVTGNSAQLAVVFDIAKDWHLYWRNPGDSGLPPRVKFSAPQGVTIEPVKWPGPTKYVEGGMLVTYIHKDQLVLIYPLSIRNVQPGTNITISAKVDWLVCKEECVPGRADLKIKLPAASSAKPSPEQSLIVKTLPQTPLPVGQSKPFQATWNKYELVISARQTAELQFFPYKNELDIYPEESTSQMSRTTLRLPYAMDVAKLSKVNGVLAIRLDNHETFHEVEFSAPSKSNAERSANNP